MKKLLLLFCLFASTSTYAQTNLEAELPGTWTVVEVIRLTAPGADPMKIEQAKEMMKSLKFEFRADHYVRIEASEQMLEIPEGYWEASGNRVRIGHWADKNTKGNLAELAVQQREGRWYFVLEDLAEVEVRKD